MPAVLQFPDDFIWGVATSSQQIEGAFHEDGRGESIWDRFDATPGKIADGSNAGIACDHYHRWRDDIVLMRGWASAPTASPSPGRAYLARRPREP